MIFYVEMNKEKVFGVNWVMGDDSSGIKRGKENMIKSGSKWM